VATVEYVMVPVPEELAPRVLAYVSWKGPPSTAASREAEGDAPTSPFGAPEPVPDTGDPIARAFAHLDDAGRALAGVLATAALDQEQLTVPESARRAGLTTREVVGAVVELVNLVASEGGPPIAAFIKDTEGANEAGFSWDTRVVMMPESVARPLVDLVRDHPSA
jgi:hypothetical protein